MKPRRIHIVGGPGSGKTSTAARLARFYGIPAIDLDKLFWQEASGGYGTKAAPEERDAALQAILEQPAWITEGVYQSWVGRCFEEADVVLIMNTPVWLRHWRILIRFVKRWLGLEQSKHESLADLFQLLRWNHAYDRKTLLAIRRMLMDQGRNAIECRDCADALEALERQSRALHPAVGSCMDLPLKGQIPPEAGAVEPTSGAHRREA